VRFRTPTRIKDRFFRLTPGTVFMREHQGPYMAVVEKRAEDGPFKVVELWTGIIRTWTTDCDVETLDVEMVEKF